LSKRDFEKLLLEAIDEGLASLGESSKEAIYFHLDKSFSIKKQEIPDKVEAFTGAIENIFGWGANFLEILIMEKLHEKVGHDLKWQEPKELKFTEYLTVAKQSFLGKKRIGKTTEEIVQCEQIVMGH